jgi:DNA-binding CsgD family transcriptional regulator
VVATSKGKPQNGRPRELGLVPRYVEGVILLDLSLRILAFDEGAAAILNGSPQPEPETDWNFQVPKEILDALQVGFTLDPLARRVRFRVGSRGYMCRIHDAQSQVEGIPDRVTVLHLARDLSMADALSQISAEYRLTLREQQALEGVLLGLTSKEVAERMSISPNTVKAFLRLVMGKMGVASRTGIVAKLFEPNGHG